MFHDKSHLRRCRRAPASRSWLQSNAPHDRKHSSDQTGYSLESRLEQSRFARGGRRLLILLDSRACSFGRNVPSPIKLKSCCQKILCCCCADTYVAVAFRSVFKNL